MHSPQSAPLSTRHVHSGCWRWAATVSAAALSKSERVFFDHLFSILGGIYLQVEFLELAFDTQHPQYYNVLRTDNLEISNVQCLFPGIANFHLVRN